jgi:metal-dependent amidase/aminoacylase/carboxypeptidase family protein
MKPRAPLLATGLALLLSAMPHALVQAQDVAKLNAQTDAIYERAVSLRRELHRHPELAGQEVQTAATVAARLRALGLEVQTGQYGHSVVGVLRGARPGRTVAWRAELDALRGEFQDVEPFASAMPGVHHACGHDIHVGIALGIAEVLSRQRRQLSGTVVFVFQPQEETFRGAKGLLDQGLFATLTPKEIYALHVTALPVGQILVRPGEMFAHQRRVRIRLKEALSPAQITALSQRVQAELSRHRPGAQPWDLPRVADPEVGLTAPGTAFQDYLIMDSAFDVRSERGEQFLEANLYETTAARLPQILGQIERTVADAGHAAQFIDVAFVQADPTVMNDPMLTEAAMRSLRATLGASQVALSHGQAPFFNDDFAYFQQRVPGVYFFLGGSNPAKQMVAMNHAPGFRVDEDSMRVAVKGFSALLVDRLSARD